MQANCEKPQIVFYNESKLSASLRNLLLQMLKNGTHLNNQNGFVALIWSGIKRRRLKTSVKQNGCKCFSLQNTDHNGTVRNVSWWRLRKNNERPVKNYFRNFVSYTNIYNINITPYWGLHYHFDGWQSALSSSMGSDIYSIRSNDKSKATRGR